MGIGVGRDTRGGSENLIWGPVVRRHCDIEARTVSTGISEGSPLGIREFGGKVRLREESSRRTEVSVSECGRIPVGI